MSLALRRLLVTGNENEYFEIIHEANDDMYHFAWAMRKTKDEWLAYIQKHAEFSLVGFDTITMPPILQRLVARVSHDGAHHLYGLQDVLHLGNGALDELSKNVWHIVLSTKSVPFHLKIVEVDGT